MIPDRESPTIIASQRNRAVVAAILMVASAFGAVLPGVVRRNREITAANAELVDLQGTIVRVQRQIRDTQAAIIRTQGEISALQQHK